MIQVKRISHATLETPDLERQVDYFTQVVGLAVAGRENGRVHLATKVGDLAVQLEKGDTHDVWGWRFRSTQARRSTTSARDSKLKMCAASRATTPLRALANR